MYTKASSMCVILICVLCINHSRVQKLLNTFCLSLFLSEFLEQFLPFKEAMGLNLVDHGNWFGGVLWKRRMISISCFLTHQKYSSYPKLWMVPRWLAPMSNSIAFTNFNHYFLIITIFQISVPNWATTYHGIILENLAGSN